MLKEKETLFRRVMIVGDGFVVALAYLTAFLLRDFIKASNITLRDYEALFFIAVPLWCLTLYANGAFLPMRTRSYPEILWVIIKSAALTFFAFGTFLFLFKLTFISRLFFLLFAGLSFLFILIEKTALYLGAHYARRRSMNTRRLLIVGTGRRAVAFIRKIDQHPEWGFEILGAINDEPARNVAQVDRLKVIGTLEDIPRIFHSDAVDEVVFVVPRTRLNALHNALIDCETEGIVVTIAIDLFDMRIAKSSVTEIDGMPLLRFKTTMAKEWQLSVKRIFDFSASGLGIIFLAPFLTFVAVLIKLTSPGPVFFKQPRLGFHGRKFTLYKFRTMRKGAQDHLNDVVDLNEMTTPEFREKKTAWITPVGRFLRKFSLDELPQLFNVFVGHMSIVGPRPTVPDEVEKYKTWQRRRFSMKPGITCLWQVEGRNNIAFEDWMKLDLEYLDNWSLKLDFIILVRTIPVVVFGIGAY
jgi:exopolysaccharide biosynthesis polyprenyl glycosylphosphotransferase